MFNLKLLHDSNKRKLSSSRKSFRFSHVTSKVDETIFAIIIQIWKVSGAEFVSFSFSFNFNSSYSFYFVLDLRWWFESRDANTKIWNMFIRISFRRGWIKVISNTNATQYWITIYADESKNKGLTRWITNAHFVLIMWHCVVNHGH